MKIPQKVLSRKDEITISFLALADSYINELKNGQLAKRKHTKDFAAQLFIHPVHLTHTIKLTTGKSPCEHFEARIVEEMQVLLKTTSLPIHEISMRFGFQEATNFTKFFKNLSGQTPLQYRKTQIQQL